jgi:hypothetical protein
MTSVPDVRVALASCAALAACAMPAAAGAAASAPDRAIVLQHGRPTSGSA